MNKRFIKTLSHHYSFAKKLICAGALLLSTQYNASAQFVKVGVGGGSNTVTTYPTPFGNDNAGQRAQYIYRAAELLAAGMKPGWIDTMGFLVTNTNFATGHTALKFFVGSPTSAATTGPTGTLFNEFAPDPELRYYDKFLAYLPMLGWNNFNFSSPYYWNGTDNILVSTCFWSGVDNKNASTEWTTPGDLIAYPSDPLTFYPTWNGASRTYVRAASTTAGIAVCDHNATTKGLGNPSSNRPNIQFRMNSDTCKLKPSAGIAASSVPEFCLLSTDSIELSLKSNSLSFGLTFQWQMSPSLTGPWTNIGPVSGTKVNKMVYQTEATYYRCVVVCTFSSMSDTSKPILVNQAAPYKCDCTSESQSNLQEKILSVGLSAMFNATPCAPGAGLYEDFTASVAPAEVEPGTEYTVNIRLGSCDTFNKARAVKVWIDFNQSATYELSEMVYANTYSAVQPNPQNASGTFTIPTTAKKGLTTMRIVYGQGSLLSDITPCGLYNFGETQDYAVNVLPFGKPTVTGRLTVCEHDSVVMNAFSTADTPVVFTWTGPGGFTGVGPKITFVDADPSLTGTYYVTVTSGGRTSTPLAVDVVVNPKPPVPNVLNANICQYEADGTLKTDGKNVIWYNVPVGGFGDTTAPKLPTHTPNTSTFYITQTINGCVSDRGKVVVNVLLKPAPPSVTSPVTYCQLQVPDLAAKGTNLKWYLDSAGGVASTISPIPPTGFPDTLDYYVSQTINGCESDRARVRVIVYEQPNGLILHSKPFVCQYDTATFYYFGSAPSTYEYKWFSNDATLESGGGQGPVVFRFNTPGEKVVSLFVNNGKCATFRINDTITSRPAPTAIIDTVVTNSCVNVPVTITIDTVTPNVDRFDWNWDGGYLVNETMNGGPYGVVWTTPGYKVLHLTVYHRTCPSLDITDTVLVHEAPTAKILSTQKVTNYGRDTAFVNGKLCSRDTLIFTAYQDLTYTYKWWPSFYFQNDTTHIAADRIGNPGFIRVDVTTAFGCKLSDSIFVNVEACCEMGFPNAFTPNNDGKNDIFRPIRDGRQDIAIFRVANRWGQVVYESSNTDQEGWDGTFGGKPQDMGTYQFYIKYQCLDGIYYEKKGDVTLIR